MGHSIYPAIDARRIEKGDWTVQDMRQRRGECRCYSSGQEKSIEMGPEQEIGVSGRPILNKTPDSELTNYISNRGDLRE